MPHKLSNIKEETIRNSGWNSSTSNPYGEEAIDKIADNTDDVAIPVTSIPSPFAQMHLVETAFTVLNEAYKKRGAVALDGKSTYHVQVSNCLDVYELLFSYDLLSLSGRISIENWRYDQLAAMENTGEVGTKVFSQALRVFIDNYNREPRFSRNGINAPFNNLTLIYFDHELLAGSSPFTGFMLAADAVAVEVKNLEGRNFFTGTVPLYKRSKGFQRFIFALFANEPLLIKGCHEVYSYLQNNLKDLVDADLRKEEKSGTLSLQEYAQLSINNNPVYILGEQVVYRYDGLEPGDLEDQAKKSDYVVQTSKKLERPPLLLLPDTNMKHWKYLRGGLPEDIDIPENVVQECESRELPGYDFKYPYLTRNDLLARHLVKLKYEVNLDKFVYPENCEAKDVLLPVTPTYFNYFTIKDLKEQLKIQKLRSGGVVVKLEIPVKGDGGAGIVTVERTYNPVNTSSIDSEQKGAIVRSSLGFGIYPFFKVEEPVFNDRYKILSYHETEESVHCSFLKTEETKPISTSVQSVATKRTGALDDYFFETNYIELTSLKKKEDGGTNIAADTDVSFDFVNISITVDGVIVKAAIIPDFGKPIQLTTSYSAISFDIGTTNSFVAFDLYGNKPEKLTSFKGEIRSADPLLVMLHHPSAEEPGYSAPFDFNSRVEARYSNAQYNEFIPSLIGVKQEFDLPIRTMLNQSVNAKPGKFNDTIVLGNVNIPFALHTHIARRDMDVMHSNLKWGIAGATNHDARNRLYAFKEELTWMGRNRLLAERKDPRRTEVIWFKPLSMGANQMTVFRDNWRDLHACYFSKDINERERLHEVTESWAPVYSYPTGRGTGEVFMNLDIGGGTTDMLIFKDKKPQLTTSFRFAGDSLFDEGLTQRNEKDNGFVTKYEQLMRETYGEHSKNTDILNYIRDSSSLRSVDLISFFFSTKAFVDLLKLDSDFQILFLLHNTAIFYHSAQILKLSGHKIPNYIGLSGNGARLLEVTNRDSNLNRPRGFAKVVSQIFKHVYDSEDAPKVELKVLDDPKDSTALGGLRGLDRIREQEGADLECFTWSVGDETQFVVANDVKAKKANQYLNFLESGDNTIANVAANVNGFFEYFFDELWDVCDFPNNFGVDKAFETEKLKDYFCDTEQINASVRDAVNYKSDVEREKYINETLFFAPIKAFLYDFSKVLASSDVNEYKGH
jgi:hypothetical protein